MRAGAWSTNRDLAAARVSWERAAAIADAMPAEDPDQLSMRIAPAHHAVCHRLASPRSPGKPGRFAELRELCSAAGDKARWPSA